MGCKSENRARAEAARRAADSRRPQPGDVERARRLGVNRPDRIQDWV